jgi:hypothetical protein
MSWECLAAFGTFVSGVSTFAVAILTFLLIRENRLLRKAGNSPRVVAHFEAHPDGTGGLNVALTNVGTGPAFDVSFEFVAEPADFENYDIIFKGYRAQRSAMTMIAQGEKVSFLFAMGFNLFRPKNPSTSSQLKPFSIKLNWCAIGESKQFSETYRLDVSAYAGLPGMMGKPYSMRVIDELAGIKKQLGKLASHSDDVARIAALVDATLLEQGMRKVEKGSPSDDD